MENMAFSSSGNQESLIIIKVGKRYFFIKPEEILWLEADRGYVKIHLGERYYTVSMSLQEMEKKLNPERFIRISKSHIINLMMVQQLTDSQMSHEFTVKLKDNTELTWGRGYRKNFPRRLVIK